jgi:hypothetical protein
MSPGINSFGRRKQACWQFRPYSGGETSKLTDDVGAVRAGELFLSSIFQKAIRESEFYRDSDTIGMGSEIIGSDRSEIIGKTHRNHRLAPRSSVAGDKSYQPCRR